jgi:aldose sugar dehydrogenase
MTSSSCRAIAEAVSSPAMTLPRLPVAFACLLFAAFAGACGGGGSKPSGDGGVVNSSARIGWDQQARDAAELATLHFVMYIDGARTELPEASCSPPAGAAGFPCESPLPSMTAGQHTIQVASYIVAGSIIESPKSAPLVITIAGSGASLAGSVTTEAQASATSVPAPASDRDLITADGARLRVEMLVRADGLSALAVSGDGTVFIGDRSGVLRIVRDGVLAGESMVAGDGAAAGKDSVVDLALDPQFMRTHLVYVLEATSGQAPAFRLSRFREAGGRLGERAVLLDAVPASPLRPSASMAFGSDGRLFVAFDDGGDPDNARRPATYNGKVLRLSADGTTPADQPGATPIYASSLQAPRSLAWDASTASLWLADAGTRLAERIRGTGRRLVVRTPFRLPFVEGPSSIAMYRGALIPALQGSLLAAPVEDATYLLRARFSSTDQSAMASTERLAIPGDGFVRVVKIAPDGAIYVGTDRAVLRIVPR